LAEDNPVASKFVMPVYCKRLQVKSSHHWTFGLPAGNQVLDWNLEATGRSHSDRTWGKWIRYGEACAHILGRYQEHQRLGRFSFCADSGYLDHYWYFVAEDIVTKG